MVKRQSKDESLHEQTGYGYVERVETLCREGANLECIDQEGRTPLIVACMTWDLYDVAGILIKYGAKVNAYRRGHKWRKWGTPLHHAAKRGLEKTVKLLLSHGANALLVNGGDLTPLDVARDKGYTNVVRTIEGHMALFSGWLREFHSPKCPLLSRKVWVVICPSQEPTEPFKLELAIYPSMQDAKPRAKANLEEPKFHFSDHSVTIVDNASRTRYKFAPDNEGDTQQLQCFWDACKGIPQAMQPAILRHVHPPVRPTAPPVEEDRELAMAINASIQSAMQELPPPFPAQQGVGTSASTIDPSPIDMSPPVINNLPPVGYSGSNVGNEENRCVVCEDAPIEGAFVPCGHMAGCMSCLEGIKAQKSECPVCRTKIDQVLKLYAVRQ